jgi:hypothetical protein
MTLPQVALDQASTLATAYAQAAVAQQRLAASEQFRASTTLDELLAQAPEVKPLVTTLEQTAAKLAMAMLGATPSVDN